jgi:23S rRNA (adenine2030-N6)-methyltransferase
VLSYQHGYHAGNAADVHKHAVLASALDYMTRKNKPLTYVETHAGRGVYDLRSAEALKTGEAAQGIGRLEGRFVPDHPYLHALTVARERFGASAYPGSPLVAASLLRPGDRMHLCERHPVELAALQAAMGPLGARILAGDGYQLARALLPPDPRRGMVVIDPSYETSDDYAVMPAFVAEVMRRWNVGVVMLWYPLLHTPRHEAMVRALEVACPDGLRHEVRFPPARDGHRMVGSGLFVVHPPFGLERAAAQVAQVITQGQGGSPPA